MTASRHPLLKVLRLHGPWLAALLLCQCQMPSREAWRYIRTNGLFTYWGTSHPSPPFGASGHYAHRYTPARSSYLGQRYPSRYQNSVTPGTRIPYRAPATSNYYTGPIYSAPAPVGPARPTPRPSPSRIKPRSEPRSMTRIPVDEPSPSAPVVRNEPAAPNTVPSVAARSNSSAPALEKPAADLPYGSAVPGRPNMVNSPYAGKTQLVDVSGMTAGQTVKCPYSGKLFKVPSSQQAANNAEPKLESKMDTPKMSSEPKAEEKKP